MMSQLGYSHVSTQGLSSDDRMSQLINSSEQMKGNATIMSQPDQRVVKDELFDNTLFKRMKERNIAGNRTNNEKENSIKELKTNRGRIL